MPSLKMKTKTTTDCLKEKHCLHVCRKSTSISKNILSHSRVTQTSEEITTCNQSSHDASLYDKVYPEDDGRNKIAYNELTMEEKLPEKPPSTSIHSATMDNPEPTTSTCTANMETIFSPILDTIDLQYNKGSDYLYVPHLDSEDSDANSRSSCEYQACNVSDFYISDMIFSGSTAGSDSVYASKAGTAFLTDYKYEESSLLCDLSEECMVLPYLDNTLDAQHNRDGHQSEETFIDAECTSLYMAIHQLRSYNQESHLITYPDTDYEYFDPQMYIRNLPEQLDPAFNLLPIPVPNEKPNMKQITLVLDLDETLVHSTLDQCDDADFTFPVFFNLKEHTVYVRQRPHLRTFLERVAEMFEIVVFTASQSIYAKQLLDKLDPEGKLISRRAYRESCIFSEGSYMKDLTVLGVDLAKIAIIDNSPQVFRLQVNNGIPIMSWFDDPSDCALISLLPFLETLVDADDVRPIIARKFGNKE